MNFGGEWMAKQQEVSNRTLFILVVVVVIVTVVSTWFILSNVFDAQVSQEVDTSNSGVVHLSIGNTSKNSESPVDNLSEMVTESGIDEEK